MNSIKAAIVAIAFFPTIAFSQTIYLDCSLIAAPDYLRSIPKKEMSFGMAALMEGKFNFVVDPPLTWILDLKKKEIRGENHTFSTINITEFKITGVKNRSDFFRETLDLNRVSGRLLFTRFRADPLTIDGIAIPDYLDWEMQCSGTSSPAF